MGCELIFRGEGMQRSYQSRGFLKRLATGDLPLRDSEPAANIGQRKRAQKHVKKSGIWPKNARIWPVVGWGMRTQTLAAGPTHLAPLAAPARLIQQG